MIDYREDIKYHLKWGWKAPPSAVSTSIQLEIFAQQGIAHTREYDGLFIFTIVVK